MKKESKTAYIFICNDLDKALEQLPIQGFRGHVEFQGGTMADWGRRK